MTALKHPSLLLDTPASITALRGDRIAVTPAASLSDVMRQTPGMQIVQNGTTLQRIVLRGVQSAGEATTGVYYDETPVTGPAGSAADPGASQPALRLFDIDRIEVLRGPQGTLFGSGSMGGTLRIILSKPDLDRYRLIAKADGSAVEGGGLGHAVRGVANVPLIHDLLAVRIVGYSEVQGGYIDNVRLGTADINHNRIDGTRLLVAVRPADNLRINLTTIRQTTGYDDATSYWYPKLGTHRTDSNIVGEYHEKLALFSGTAEWTLPFATLTGAASRYDWRQRTSTDYTPTLARALADARGCAAYFSLTGACDANRIRAFRAYGATRLPGAWRRLSHLRSDSQEVRLRSSEAGSVHWTIGIFAERRRDDFGSYVYRADTESGRVLVIPGDETGYRTIDNAISQRALFGEASWRPVPKLTLTAGARRYAYKTAVGGQVIVPNYITGSSATAYRRSKTDASGWVGKWSVSYQAARSTLAYATVADGFRPGGVNNVPGAGDTLPSSYSPDSLRSYEAGLKTSLLAGRLVASTALTRSTGATCRSAPRAPMVRGTI